MSVWSSPYFKYDGPQALAKLLPEDKFPLSTLNFTVDDSQKLTALSIKANLSYAIRNKDVSLEDFGFQPALNENDDFVEISKQKTTWHTGMLALAHLTTLIVEQKIEPIDSIPWAQQESIFREVVQLVAPSTQMHVESFVSKMLSNDISVESRRWRSLAESIKMLKIALLKKKDKSVFTSHPEFLKTTHLAVHSVGEIVYMSRMDNQYQQALVFTFNELDRVIVFYLCIATALEYASLEEEPWLSEVIRFILKNFKVTLNDGINSYCKALLKYRDRYIAKLGDDLSLFDFAELDNDIKEGSFYNFFSWSDYTKLIEQAPMHRRFDALNAFKILPPPDFCHISAMNANKKYHDTPSVCTADLDDFMIHTRYNYIKTFRKTYGYWPGSVKPGEEKWREEYRTNTLAKFKETYVPEIVLTATLNLVKKGVEALMKQEDKSIAVSQDGAYNSIEAFKKCSKYEKAAILNLLRENELPNYSDLEVSSVPKYVQAEFKAESHKPLSRIIYVSNLRSRILKNDVEDTIRQLLHEKVGSSMGSSVRDLEKYLAAATAWYNNTTIGDYTQCYFSFDMAKWSPRFPHDVKKKLWEFWSDVTGVSNLSDRINLTLGTTVVSVKCNMIVKYVTNAVDFEGDQGAMNTWFHSDLMSYTLKRIKPHYSLDQKAYLCTFVDDGLMSVVLPRSEIRNFWKDVETSYKSFGFITSAGKTLISTSMATYLGRTWVEGTEVSCGLKSFLKIQPDYSARFKNFLDDVNMLFSMVQGSIKTGTSWIAGYWKYLWDFVYTVIKWSRWGRELLSASPQMVAIAIFTPVGLGGCGAATLQGLVTTLESSTLSMGIGVLNSASRSYPTLVKPIEAILNQALSIATPVDLMRNAGSVKRLAMVIKKNLLEKRLKEKISSGEILVGQWLKDLAEDATNFPLDSFAEAMMEPNDSGVVMNYIMRKEVFKLTPVYTYEKYLSKYKRSMTMSSMLLPGEMNSINSATRNNFSEALKITLFLMY